MFMVASPSIILTLSFFLVIGLLIYTFKRLGRGQSLKILLKGFKRKIWMTVSLGTIFFSFYFVIVTLSASVIPRWGTDLFFLVYRHPIEFVYGGLWLFATLSLSIYLARMFVKYFFLTRGKDS